MQNDQTVTDFEDIARLNLLLPSGRDIPLVHAKALRGSGRTGVIVATFVIVIIGEECRVSAQRIEIGGKLRHVVAIYKIPVSFAQMIALCSAIQRSIEDQAFQDIRAVTSGLFRFVC